MTTMKAQLSVKESQCHQKLLYYRPILKTYGSVKSLTAGGPFNDTEQNPGQPTGSCNSNPALSKPLCSDRSAKENIVYVGSHSPGIGLYLFEYKSAYRQTWGHGMQFGVMADEVEQVLPEAVCVHPDGHKVVDYAMLGISHTVA